MARYNTTYSFAKKKMVPFIIATSLLHPIPHKTVTYMERPHLTRIEAEEICIWGRVSGGRFQTPAKTGPNAHLMSQAMQKIIPLNGVLFFSLWLSSRRWTLGQPRLYNVETLWWEPWAASEAMQPSRCLNEEKTV